MGTAHHCSPLANMSLQNEEMRHYSKIGGCSLSFHCNNNLAPYCLVHTGEKKFLKKEHAGANSSFGRMLTVMCGPFAEKCTFRCAVSLLSRHFSDHLHFAVSHIESGKCIIHRV